MNSVKTLSCPLYLALERSGRSVSPESGSRPLATNINATPRIEPYFSAVISFGSLLSIKQSSLLAWGRFGVFRLLHVFVQVLRGPVDFLRQVCLAFVNDRIANPAHVHA